jgi:hypothetical protein
MLNLNYTIKLTDYLGRFTPYLERPWCRFLTAMASKVPLTM